MVLKSKILVTCYQLERACARYQVIPINTNNNMLALLKKNIMEKVNTQIKKYSNLN